MIRGKKRLYNTLKEELRELEPSMLISILSLWVENFRVKLTDFILYASNLHSLSSITNNILSIPITFLMSYYSELNLFIACKRKVKPPGIDLVSA